MKKHIPLIKFLGPRQPRTTVAVFPKTTKEPVVEDVVPKVLMTRQEMDLIEMGGAVL